MIDAVNPESVMQGHQSLVTSHPSALSGPDVWPRRRQLPHVHLNFGASLPFNLPETMARPLLTIELQASSSALDTKCTGVSE